MILTLYMLLNIRTSDTKSGEEEAPKRILPSPAASEEPLPLLAQEPVVKNGEILPTLVICTDGSSGRTRRNFRDSTGSTRGKTTGNRGIR
ncbi:MAG: hypothetical protein MZU97_03825 [Bacillus subtilis]|nr:hypothetical protein [Bacillus subtilis]